MSRFSKILGALSIATLPLLATTPAIAQPPEPIHSYLTDTVDTITSPDTLTKKIENFANKTPYELYIVIVDDFDGETPEQWTDKTVDLSSLDTNSILFALATESREYGWTSTTTSIDANDINDAIDDDVYSNWSHNDYEEGLTLFVTNLTDELSGTSSSSHSSQSSSNTESNVIGSLVGIGVVGVVAGQNTPKKLPKSTKPSSTLKPAPHLFKQTTVFALPQTNSNLLAPNSVAKQLANLKSLWNLPAKKLHKLGSFAPYWTTTFPNLPPKPSK